MEPFLILTNEEPEIITEEQLVAQAVWLTLHWDELLQMHPNNLQQHGLGLYFIDATTPTTATTNWQPLWLPLPQLQASLTPAQSKLLNLRLKTLVPTRSFFIIFRYQETGLVYQIKLPI